MMRRVYVVGAIALLVANCGYPSFSFNGSGGSPTTGPSTVSSGGPVSSSSSAGASSSATTGSTTSAAVSSSSSSAASSSASASSGGSGGMPSVCPNHVVLAEVQTRGLLGGGDEFVTLYNPTPAPIVLSNDWTLQGRSQKDTSDTERWQGNSGVIPAYGYFLIAGPAYSGAPDPDDLLSDDISDAGRLNLVRLSNTVDSLCYAYNQATLTMVEAFTCPGTPATNPHDDNQDSDEDNSMARAPFDCTDTNDNVNDFEARSPSTPKNTATAPIMFP